MNKTLFLIFLFLTGCANQSNTKYSNYQSLIAYQKYDFINSQFIANSEIVLTLYPKGFLISKSNCGSIFFNSTSTNLPIDSNQTIISGSIDINSSSDCWGNYLDLEVSKNPTLFNNKDSYKINIQSDSYNFVIQ